MKSIVLLYCIFIATFAAIMHSPGHVSMDTSVQLYEAYIGESISFNPPIMSALLKLMGGGELATAIFTSICIFLTYGSFSLIVQSSGEKITFTKLVLTIFVISNPIIFSFLGSVWKDVIFSSLIIWFIALNFYSIFSKKILISFLSITLLPLIMFIRQQGIFIAPFLLLIPIYLSINHNFYKKYKITVISILIITFGISTYAVDSISANLIKPNGTTYSLGLRNIFLYDIIGSAYYSGDNLYIGSNELNLTSDQINKFKKAYSPVSIDFIDHNQGYSWAENFTNEKLFKIWIYFICKYPFSYLKHKVSVFSSSLGYTYNSDLTRPTFTIGIQGNPQYLAVLNINQGNSLRSMYIYQYLRPLYNYFIFTHFFWMLISILSIVVVNKSRLIDSNKFFSNITFLTISLIYLMNFFTNLSWDYRYLYPIIPLTSILFLIMFYGQNKTIDTHLKNE